MRESERKREVSYFIRGPTDSAARQAASSCNILMGDAAAALLARTIFVLTHRGVSLGRAAKAGTHQFYICWFFEGVKDSLLLAAAFSAAAFFSTAAGFSFFAILLMLSPNSCLRLDILN